MGGTWNLVMVPKNLRITPGKGPSLEKIRDRLNQLADLQVLVGVPADETERDDDESGLTNAALAYIHDNGAPEESIPPRPFMRPGIESIKPEIQRRMAKMAKAAVTSNEDVMAQQATALGLRAKLAIQNQINEGIPPPLADSTLRRRASKGREGAKEELKRRREGEAPGTELAKPLIDSAQMRNSINYVLRSRKGES